MSGLTQTSRRNFIRSAVAGTVALPLPGSLETINNAGGA